MTSATVTIIDTGVANTASVGAAFARCGVDTQLATDRQSVDRADLLALPGVGAFGAGMARLDRAGLVEPIRARVCEHRPTLAICLGLQLLCRGSEETPGVDGIGAIDAQLGVFSNSVRSPQYGWNLVEPAPGCRLVESGYAYFANTYRLGESPPGWHVASANHGGPFVAALECGAVLACQFHPELSGAWGAELLQRWVSSSMEVSHAD